MATNDPRPGSNPGGKTEQVGERLQMEKEAATRAAGSAWEGAKEAGSEALDQARKQAEVQGEKLKEGASDELDAFAAAIMAASEKLSERQPGFMADLMGQAASGLHGVSEALQRRSTGDLVDSIRDFGRRNPTAFIAGSVLTGFALGRFAGSTATHRRRSAAASGQAGMAGTDTSKAGPTGFGATSKRTGG